MSAPQGRSRRRLAEEEDEVVSMVGQRVWFVDQIEPVGVIRQPIEHAGKVIGFVIEDERSRAVRRVQRSRVRKYGDRLFLVTSWFAKADQAARELEKQLAGGMAPDRDLRYWQQFSNELGAEVLKTHLTRVAPPTYAVAGQLAATAEALAQDLARASVTFKRVQRALVANQSVMSPEEYAQFVDEARKWSRTVRLVLMSVEFLGRALPHAQIDVRNPDAPLPAGAVYIPFESLLEAHTPSGEGKARESAPAPTVESGAADEFSEVFGEEPGQGEWQEAEDFEAAAGPGEFAPIKPLREYEEASDFAPVEEPPSSAEVETFEVVAEPTGPAPETFEAVTAPEEAVEFEEVAAPPAPAAAAPAAPAAGPALPAPGSGRPSAGRAAASGTPGVPSPPPTPPRPAKGAAAPAGAPAGAPAAAAPSTVQSLPEEEDEVSFSSGRRSSEKPSQWLTPPSPPPPRPAQVRQVERQERLKDKPNLDAIIAASLGRTAKKSASNVSQGEIAGSDVGAPKPATDALSRELASLLEKSKRK